MFCQDLAELKIILKVKLWIFV